MNAWSQELYQGLLSLATEAQHRQGRQSWDYSWSSPKPCHGQVGVAEVGAVSTRIITEGKLRGGAACVVNEFPKQCAPTEPSMGISLLPHGWRRAGHRVGTWVAQPGS